MRKFPGELTINGLMGQIFKIKRSGEDSQRENLLSSVSNREVSQDQMQPEEILITYIPMQTSGNIPRKT